MAAPNSTERGRRGLASLFSPVDSIVAALIIAACAILWYESTRFEKVPDFLGQNVLPEHFPRLALVFIILSTLILPFEHRIFPDRWRKIAKEHAEPVPLITWKTIALLLLLVAGVPYIGMIMTIVAICVTIPVLWGERRILSLAVFSLSFAVVITWIFNKILGVHFEPGIFNIRF